MYIQSTFSQVRSFLIEGDRQYSFQTPHLSARPPRWYIISPPFTVLALWLEGESIETIFSALPANKRSQRRPGLQTWLQGVSEDSTWTDQFAKFYDFMSNCVKFFLPWVLRAARPLAEVSGQPERPWGEWARFVELGVDSTWSVRLIDGGLVAERAVARQIGHAFDELMLNTEPTIEQVQQVLIEIIGSDDSAVTQVLEWYRQRET